MGRPIDLPGLIGELAAQLFEQPGAVGVVLGGSRATGTERPDSDWDLGLYYRGGFDPAGVRRLGHPGYVSGLDEWGPIMNGGAWLTVGGIAVDVLFRDIDLVEHWLGEARAGQASVALMFASTNARLGDTVGCGGMLSSAVLCAAHARLAARREWVLNEKRLVERAGLGDAQDVLAQPDDSSVNRISELIGIEPLRPR